MKEYFDDININVILVDNPQFSNAIGGLKYGKRQFKKEEISS